ncbi:hypothetical protein O1L60_34700 [Streptomyces diastatochromogenes]|nr:hypothetical protein [Streptomyces diastatochromogenes]
MDSGAGEGADRRRLLLRGRHRPGLLPGTATRLTATQQQAVGATYVAASARLFVGGDDAVRPLLDGTGRRAPRRARRGSSPTPSAPAAHRRSCRAPRSPSPAAAGSAPRSTRRRPRLPVARGGLVAALRVLGDGPEPGRDAVAMKWTGTGSRVTVRPARPVSLAGAESLALRVIVPPNSTGTALDVAVTDGSGRRAQLGRVRVDGLPGSPRTAAHWSREVRVPLSAVTRAGLDLGGSPRSN